MRLKILLAGVAAALVIGMVPSPAGADDATVTANIAGLSGTRTFALAEAGTGVSLVGASGLSTAISGTFTATVTETAVAGDDNGYSVTAAITNLVKGTDTIAYTNINLAPGTMIPSLAGTDTPGAAGNFSGASNPSDARTVWANSAQAATSYYTFVHANTSTLGLTLPNNAVSGTYTGTLTVTFVA
jgi:hypothetical protein